MFQLLANTSGSCATGNAQPLNYIVSCYDGCTAPVADFSVVYDCVGGQFNVVVALGSLGTASQVVISNNGGVASTTASGPGQYTVGPFSNGTQVVVTVEGASLLCSLNSNTLTDDCGVGIEEIAPSRLRIYPDPGEGVFNLELPSGFGGGYEIEVLDLAGRRVQLVRSNGHGGLGISLDLTGVPTGSYVIVLRDLQRVMFGTVRVVR